MKEKKVRKTSLRNANKLKQDRTEKISRVKEEYDINYIAIALITLVIAIFVFLFFKYGSLFGINILKINNDKVLLVTDTSLDVEYHEYLNKLLQVSYGNLKLYDNQGKEKWNYDFETNFYPNIYIKNDYMILINNALNKLYLFNGEKEILSKDFEKQVSKVFLDSNGNFITEYYKNGYNKNLDIFDKRGVLKYTISIDNEAIINIDILNNANKLLITQVDSNFINSGVKISKVDIDKSEEIEVFTNFQDKLIFETKIVDDSLITVTEKDISKIDLNTNNQNNILNFLDNKISNFDLNNNYYCIIKNLNNEYVFETKKYNNSLIAEYRINKLPKSIETKGLANYIVFENSILVINKWGIVLDEFSINIPPKKIIVYNDSKTVALIYTNRVEILNI